MKAIISRQSANGLMPDVGTTDRTVQQKAEKPKKAYRVFVDRHYIAVCWVDVKATDAKKAAKLAVKYCEKTIPDARTQATDNHWHATEGALEIDHIGTGTGEPYGMIEVLPDVFKAHESNAPSSGPKPTRKKYTKFSMPASVAATSRT